MNKIIAQLQTVAKALSQQPRPTVTIHEDGTFTLHDEEIIKRLYPPARKSSALGVFRRKS